MPTENDILEQQRLLQAYRGTLSIYLHQRALLGITFLPPSIAHGIAETRASIQQIKTVLSNWEIKVEDHPNDEEDQSPEGTAANLSNSYNRFFEIALALCMLADRFKAEANQIRVNIIAPAEQQMLKDSELPLTFRRNIAARTLQELCEVNQKAKFILPCGKEVDEQINKLCQLFGQYSSNIALYLQLGEMGGAYHNIGLFIPQTIEQPRKELFESIFVSGGDEFITLVDKATE